jgi:hypothetical protein
MKPHKDRKLDTIKIDISFDLTFKNNSSYINLAELIKPINVLILDGNRGHGVKKIKTYNNRG